MKNGQKLNLGDAHVIPRNIQEVQASKLGDAPEAPLLHWQKLGHLSTHYIFYCFMHYAFFLERLYFLLLVLFCFVCCNKWLDANKFPLEEIYSLFICQEHSSFHSYRSTSVLFFWNCV
jgi:hypothetical protein